MAAVCPAESVHNGATCHGHARSTPLRSQQTQGRRRVSSTSSPRSAHRNEDHPAHADDPDIATPWSKRSSTPPAVVTTGIYCRPGCGARPLAKNNVTFELAAAAEAAGFRACLRCRPYRVAGPVSSAAPVIVCSAVQLIIDGMLDDDTETALAERVGLSTRHLRRLFRAHLGAIPDEFTRSRRAQRSAGPALGQH